MMSQTQQQNEAGIMGNNVAETNNAVASSSAIKLQTAIRSFLKRLPKPCPIRTINNRRYAKRLSDITMMDFSEDEVMMGIVEEEDENAPPPTRQSYNTRWDRQSVSMNNIAVVAASAGDKFIVPPVRRQSQSIIIENDISSLTSYSKTTTENGSSSEQQQEDNDNFAALQRLRRYGRQISLETDAAVIADKPISPPCRRESVVRFLPDQIFEISSVVDMMVFEELPSPGQVQSGGGFHRQGSAKTNMAVAPADQPVKLPKRRESVSVSTIEKSSSTASSSSSSQRVSIGKNAQRFSSSSMDTPPLGPPSRRP